MLVRMGKIASAILASSLFLMACNEGGFTGNNAKGGNAKKSQDKSKDPTDPSGIDSTGTGQKHVQTFTAAGANSAVDIVIAVDTSISMVEEMVSIEQNMGAFLNQLASGSLDAKVSLIGKASEKSDPWGRGEIFNFPPNLPADRFTMVDQLVHSVDAINILTRFFAGQYGFPFPLRNGVPLEIIIISDDNGVNMPMMTGNTAAEFVPPANKAYTVNAIVGMKAGKDPNNPSCDITRPGTEHQILVQQTKGTLLDICQTDWSALLKNLSDNIIDRNAGYVLQYAPKTSQTITVKVNGVEVPKGNYTIDAQTKSLKFNDNYTVPASATIEVTYYH